MNDIFIQRDSDTKQIEFDNDLDFTPNDHISITRKEAPKRPAPPASIVPTDGIELITNKPNNKPPSVRSDGGEHSIILDDGEEEDRASDNLVDDQPEEIHEPQKTYREILEEKQDLLFKLGRLNKSGYGSKKFTLAARLEDIRAEYLRVKRERDLDKSIRFSRKVLLTCVSGIEFFNEKFDPLGAKLDGFSENVHENIGDYDDVFEELHDKYSGKSKLPPEIRLISMVAGSAFTFHLTKSLINTAIPNVNDILRNNPDLAANIQSTVLSSMNNSNDPVSNMVRYGMQEKMKQRQSGEMRGPTGVDNILEQLHNNTNTHANYNSGGEESGNENEHVPMRRTQQRGRRKNKRELDMGF